MEQTKKFKKIIGLVGETGSGKDTFCEYVKRNFKNVFVFRFSEPLSETLKIFLEEVKKEDQQWLAIALRKRFGNNVLGEAIKKKIKNIKKGLIILDGLRAWEEFKMIKRWGGKIIYITADSKTRWQRVRKRGEKKDDSFPYRNFLEREKAATEFLIPKMGQKADFKIENNGSKQLFCKKTQKIINNLF